MIVVGALYLDVAGRIPDSTSITIGDCQEYIDWRLEIGGTGANLSRALTVSGIQTTLVSPVAEDACSRVVEEMLRTEQPGVQFVPVTARSASSGVVVMCYHHETGGVLNRLTLGPARPALNMIAPNVLARAVELESKTASHIIVDGYLLRENIAALLAVLELPGLANVEKCVELVPHDIWRMVDSPVLLDVLGRFDRISTSLSTIERLVGLQPAAPDEVTVGDRVVSLGDRLSEIGVSFPWIALRFNVEERIDSVILRRQERPVWRRGVHTLAGEVKALGEREFIYEIFGDGLVH